MNASDDQPTRVDEDARRGFWTFHMERSAELLAAMQEQPTQESGEGFASIQDAAEAVGVEMWFSDSRIAGDLDRIFFIRQSLVPDLMAIGRDMNERGWILRIEDGYRTQQMQAELGRKPAVSNQVTAYEDVDAPLTPPEATAGLLDAALVRLGLAAAG